MKKGKEKRRKITLKKGEKALKMLVWGKNESQKKEGVGDQNALCIIYIPSKYLGDW